MPGHDPIQALQALQIISVAYLIFSFIIIIYQVFLNRRQAKVKDLMEELITVTKEIRDNLIKKK